MSTAFLFSRCSDNDIDGGIGEDCLNGTGKSLNFKETE